MEISEDRIGLKGYFKPKAFCFVIFFSLWLMLA